jgi:hypothetical protein
MQASIYSDIYNRIGRSKPLKAPYTISLLALICAKVLSRP